MQKTKVLKDLQLAFVARNLCFLYKKAPFDPDLVLSTGMIIRELKCLVCRQHEAWALL